VPDSKQQSSRIFSKQGSSGRGSLALWARAVSFAVLTMCSVWTTACDRGDHPASIGSPAPQFTVSDGTQTVNLEKLRGHVVIVNFWATWCIPCIEEVPTLVELQRRMPQVSVVAISSDEDPATYAKFLADHHVDFLTVRDPSYRVPHLYGTIKIPESYVIDEKGILRRKFVSAQNWTSPEIVDYLSKQ
jgi:cytochrome c biogenesis protein CcmG/thiol:disulfide interchange protein DsbE